MLIDVDEYIKHLSRSIVKYPALIQAAIGFQKGGMPFSRFHDANIMFFSILSQYLLFMNSFPIKSLILPPFEVLDFR
jgi:hypothetical protein